MRSSGVIWSAVALAMCLLLSQRVTAADDFGLWSSVGADHDLGKGVSWQVESEYRLQDDMKKTDRWVIGTSLTARLFRNEAKTFSLKGQAGYKYMNVYKPSEIVWKGYDSKDVSQAHEEYNRYASYELSKHRVYASLQASFDAGRFRISLRQRYQITFSDSVAVTETKYRYSKALDDTYAKYEGTEWKGTDTSVDMMRSRIAVSYNIPHCKIEPYVSYEAFEGLDGGLSLLKNRYQAGAGYTLRKKHEFDVYYMYQSATDDDETSGSVLGIGYTFKF